MEVWASQEAKSHPGVMLLQEGGREGGAEVRSATFAGVKAGGVVSYLFSRELGRIVACL